jgi:hypothetical protein
MTVNATFLPTRQAVGPPRHLSAMRGGDSRLRKMPNLGRLGLEQRAMIQPAWWQRHHKSQILSD